ncbi:MAG: L-threonylcarbamoyladenylate synthase [Candidatus Dormibacteria bacterium]
MSEAEEPRTPGQLVQAGGVICFPTDTVHGLGCRHDDEAAQERVFRIKGRDLRKPLVLLGDDISRFEPYVQLDRRARSLAQHFWPGPLTLVLPLRAAVRLPRFCMNEDDPPGVAIRVPGEPALATVRLAGGILATTSANRSGLPPAVRDEELDPDFVNEVDLVVPGKSLGHEPSTVLDLCGPTPAVLRRGAVSSQELLGVLGRSGPPPVGGAR